jgi:hypothetical protein
MVLAYVAQKMASLERVYHYEKLKLKRYVG